MARPRGDEIAIDGLRKGNLVLLGFHPCVSWLVGKYYDSTQKYYDSLFFAFFYPEGGRDVWFPVVPDYLFFLPETARMTSLTYPCSSWLGFVGVPRFELGTSRTRTVRSTGLSHTPKA